MIQKIVVKEVYRLVSQLHKDRVISEYLIYYEIGDISPEAHNEIGEVAKNLRINELILQYFPENITREDFIIETKNIKELK